MVFISDRCSCTGPASKLSPAATTTGSYCYWTAWDSPAQCHRQHLVQQNWANQPISPGDSASLQHSDSYQHTQNGNIATMAKVIPNMPLKLQQRIIQGKFIDLPELLQADFQLNFYLFFFYLKYVLKVLPVPLFMAFGDFVHVQYIE